MQLASGLLLLIGICGLGVSSLSHVPVLLWSSDSSVWSSAPIINEGHITSSEEFHRLITQEDVSRRMSLVILLQDTLSMDDFTYYSAAFGSENPLHNVQDIMDSSPASRVLPAVDRKTIHDLQGYLQQQGDWNKMSADNFNVSSLDLDYTKPNLITINLQSIPRSNRESAALAFSENDRQIARITKDLQDKGVDFIAIYTGRKSPKVALSFDFHNHEVHNHGRELLSTTVSAPYPPLNVTNGTDTCILLYAKTFNVTVNGTTYDLTNQTFDARLVNTSLSTCTDSNTTLRLVYTFSPSASDGLTILEVQFFLTNMFYPGSARYWSKLESVLLIPNGDISSNASFRTTYGSSPAEYSYHCQQIGTSSAYGETLVLTNNPIGKWQIQIIEFQIQGFNIKNNLFSYASDCSSFFSPAIWMGLVSCVILLWILSYGIFMIMQLTTNDKFDDPKAPALSVPQGD